MSQLCLVIIDGLPLSNGELDSNGKIQAENFLTGRFEDAIIKYYSILEYEWYVPGVWRLGQQADEILQDLVRDENLGLATNASSKCRAIVFICNGLGGCLVKQILLLATTSSRYQAVSSLTKSLIFFGALHRTKSELDLRNYIFRLISLLNSGRHDSFALAQAFVSAFPVIQRDFIAISGNYRITNFIETQSTEVDNLVVDEYCSTMDIPVEENIRTSCDYKALWKFSEENEAMDYLVQIITGMMVVEPRNLYDQFQLFLGKIITQVTSTIAPSWTQHTFHTDSVSWVKDNPSFTEWRHNANNAVLHIDGKLGSGITLLSSFVLNFLKADPAFKDSVLLKFTITTFDLISLQPTMMLLSLSHQILAQRPALFQRVSWLCSWLLNDPGTTFTKPIAYSLLSSLLNSLSEPIFCIIENIHLIANTSECQQLLIDVAAIKKPTNPIKFLVTSELYMSALAKEMPNSGQDPTVKFSMLGEQGAVYLPLRLQSEQAMSTSIEALVRIEIRSLAQEKPYWAEFETDIMQKICIEGTTQLLAMLQINLLRYSIPPTTKASLKQTLEHLPLTLEDIYTQALPLQLTSDESKKGKCALSALSWIAFAFRPLEVREAAIALAFDNENINNIHMMTENKWNDVVGDLSAILGPLLRVVGNHLYPAHHTIRALPALARESKGFHLKALIVCLRYLRIILEENCSDTTEQNSSEGILFEKPECELLRYSSVYWPDHFRIAFSNEPCGGQDIDLRQRSIALNYAYEFLISQPLLDKWLNVYKVMITPAVYGSESAGLLDTTSFIVACRFGLLPVAEKYASSHSNYISDIEKANALDIAARFGHADMVKWLLSKGAISSQAIYLASKGGHVDVINELIQKDFTVRYVDSEGYTPFLYTAKLGHLKAMCCLLQNGASAMERFQDGSTALHFASRIGHLSAVKELVDSSDCASVDEEGYNALHRAAAGGFFEVVAYLYPRYKNIQGVSCVTNNHDTILHLAAASGSFMTCQFLLQEEPTGSINMANEQRKTPLHIAAEYGNLDVVRYILEVIDGRADQGDGNELESMGLHGPSVAPSEGAFLEEMSPSQLAAQHGHLAIMTELLDHQARLLKQTSTTEPSLWSSLDDAYLCLRNAASSGHVDIVEKLLSASVVVSRSDDEEYTPLQLAAKFGHSEVVDKISVSASQEDKATALLLASQIGNATVVRSLIRNNTPITRTKAGETPLQLAVKSGNIQVFQELVENQQALTLFQDEQDDLITTAAESGHVLFIHHIFHGGYIRAVETASDHIFQRLMKSTAVWESAKVVEVLHANGLSYEIRDAEGYQPLHIATKMGYMETIRLLVNAGALIESKTFSRSTPLFMAIQAKNRLTCQCLLELKADPNTAGEDDQMPLSLACHLGEKAFVELLLQYGADIDATNSSHQTVLHTSVRDPELMKVILRMDPEKYHIDAQDNQKQTPLLLAAELGINETVQYLLDANADSNHADEEGYTSLHSAARGGHLDTIKILIQNRADCNKKSNEGGLPLHSAATECHYNVLEYLLPLTEDINTIDQTLGTPLAAAGRSMQQLDERIRCTKLLLSKGAHVNCYGGSLYSPLQTAAWYENLDLVQLLLENGAEVNAVGGFFQSALNAAIAARHLNIMKLLLRHGADPNIAYENRSALENAIYNGDFLILETLLDEIKDLNHLISSKGLVALRMAAKMDKLELVKLMLAKGFSVKTDETELPLLSTLVSSYSHRVLEYFLHDGREYIDINEQDRDGQTTLDYAIIGDFGSAGELLDAGADPNIQDKYGNTALIHALKSESDVAGDILAFENREGRETVRCDAVDNIGRGPLYWACYFGRDSSFDFVMSKLSTLQALNPQNQGCFFATAVHAAVAKDRPNMLRKLIEHHVDVTQPDRNNWTPMHTARAYGFKEIRRILEIQLLQDSTIPQLDRKGLSLRRPLQWNKLDMHMALRLSEDGLELVLEDSFTEDKFNKIYVRTARADFCMPDDDGFFYFEIKITILECTENSTDNPEIGIGFSEEHVSLSRMVGWSSGSWGLHGDDGQLYEQQGNGKKFNRGYGSQDTIGCGVDFRKNVGFFTKNGRYLGQISDSIKGKLYPTVSFGRNVLSGACIATNFGNDENVKFVYDLKKHDQATEKAKRTRKMSTLYG